MSRATDKIIELCVLDEHPDEGVTAIDMLVEEGIFLESDDGDLQLQEDILNKVLESDVPDEADRDTIRKFISGVA